MKRHWIKIRDHPKVVHFLFWLHYLSPYAAWKHKRFVKKYVKR